MSLTRESLDKISCECDDAHQGIVELAAKCHQGEGLRAVYQRGTGKMRLLCAVCHEVITTIVIASREDVMQ